VGFRSEAELEDWLKKSGQPFGYVASLQSFYAMSADWYDSRMEEDWTPYTAREAEDLWARYGFVGEFWSLS
jgi:hypothetical protein